MKGIRMPEWGQKPETELDNALQKVLEGLEDEVADNPTFDTVTGIPLDKMIPHATEAISQVFGKNRSDLEDLIQCYAMGFVIGMKFAVYKKEGTT
jgi:hypothetical protein